MEDEISIDGNSEIPTTHIFVYKEKQYPFNFDLFKIFSQYFNSDIPKEKNIELIEENQTISEASIPDFINFCQDRKITLTKENSPTLHKLSQKYKVPLLLRKTKEFIMKHQKEVVVEIMSMYQNDNNFNLEEYEQIISDDLIKYIHDDLLLTLPIPTLHRIITKFLYKKQNQDNSNNSEQPSELIEFLFKCLDHFGREASVLFDQIDSFGSNGNLVNRLLDGYSEKFDFSFVNNGNLKTVYQLQNEIIAREKDVKKQISESKQEVLEISRQIGEQIEMMRKQREDEVNDRKEVYSIIPKLVAQEIESLRKKHEEEMKMKDEVIARYQEEMRKQREDEVNDRKKVFSMIPKLVAQEIESLRKKHEEEMKMKDEVIERYQEEMRKQREYFDEKMRFISDKLEKLRNQPITRLYYSDPISGLISLLGDDVNISAAKDHPTYPVSRLRKYNNDNFYNNSGSPPASESDTIIKFDFGSSKRIDLHSYFIRTGADGPNNDHQKTWRIEGSNDDQSWTKLDRRSDDSSLNDKYKECHFICQLGSYGSENNMFRYIRYVQEDSWNSSSSRKYFVELTYFELYGNVVTI